MLPWRFTDSCGDDILEEDWLGNWADARRLAQRFADERGHPVEYWCTTTSDPGEVVEPQ